MRKILFIMHMPPPIHGASLMGKYVRDSELINQTFDCRYLNLTIASSIEDIQKFGIKKIIRYIFLLCRVVFYVISFRPHLVYFTPNACGKPFYKDFPIMVLLKLMGQRVVAHYHNKGVSTRSERWLDNMLYRIFFHNTRVILLSERLYPDICKYVRRNNVIICPNGIPETGMLSFHREVDAQRPPILLFLSNLLVAKGVWTLLDALEELNNRGVDFKCNFAGGESADISARQLQSTINEKGLASKVSYYGQVFGQEKWHLFKESDLFVFPSHNECFPLVILEAMQSGIPCVTTAEGGIKDMVQDGVNGLICKTQDVESLALALESLIKNHSKRVSMGLAGREMFISLFSLDKFCSSLTKSLIWAMDDNE